MIVLLTGMFRSGSTWAYNAAKSLLSLESAAVAGTYTNDIGGEITALREQIQHFLIKTHMPDRIGHMLIKHRMVPTICTYRDPLDCIVSSMEVFKSNFEETVALAHGALAFLELQSKIGGILFVAHDAIVDQPAEQVAAIAGYLGCKPRPADTERIAALFSKPNVARFADNLVSSSMVEGGALPRDPDTLLHPGHIRSQPRTPDQILTPAQRRYACDRLRNFVEAEGRLADTLRARLQRAEASAR
jgi:hypothetical protein